MTVYEIEVTTADRVTPKMLKQALKSTLREWVRFINVKVKEN